MSDTMTVENDTKTRQVFISAEILASIYSLTNFADHPRNGTPILCGVQLVRDGHSVLRAYATNRYVLARGTYDTDVNFDNWELNETLWIDVATLKQAVAIAKTYNTPEIAIGYDTNNTVFVDVAGNKLFNVAGQPSYPPVHRMFNDGETPNGADVIRLNPKWLSLLTKVVTPTKRQEKDRPWMFSFFHNTENKKPNPVVAMIHDTGYEIRVLIQPNLVVR